MAAKEPSAEFVEWCNEPPESTIPKSKALSQLTSDFQDIKKRRPTTEELTSIINKEIPSNFNIHLKNGEPEFIKHPLIINSEHQATKSHLTIRSDIAANIVLKNIHIKNLNLQDLPTSTLCFENCWINNLHHRSSATPIKITIKNSYIGIMHANRRSMCGDLHFIGGAILGINTSPPKSENPFSGAVVFENTFFPRDTKKYFIKSAQPYRNMRHHLMSLENETTASMFHSLELAIERENDPPLNKFLSHCYEMFSDYGASITRPLYCLTGLLLLSLFVIAGNDGANLALAPETYKGWRTALIESKLSRAATLIGHYIFNPFGILGTKALVVPSNGFFLFWVMLQSLLSTTFITLTILAIRRRFKLKQ